MTELQFERVFSTAQDLQTARMSQREVIVAEQTMKGFEVPGTKIYATTKQAACMLNMVAMDFEGGYSESVLLQLRDCYLANVSIIGEEKGSKSKPKIKHKAKSKIKKKK